MKIVYAVIGHTDYEGNDIPKGVFNMKDSAEAFAIYMNSKEKTSDFQYDVHEIQQYENCADAITDYIKEYE